MHLHGSSAVWPSGLWNAMDSVAVRYSTPINSGGLPVGAGTDEEAASPVPGPGRASRDARGATRSVPNGQRWTEAPPRGPAFRDWLLNRPGPLTGNPDRRPSESLHPRHLPSSSRPFPQPFKKLADSTWAGCVGHWRDSQRREATIFDNKPQPATRDTGLI